mmetsp:Transcript_3924/g.8649  ORF Transcript_3924/g.8649 Transcript_3924/m.8649 type:complete len:98 (-) Transcript_3924:6-299(-)
MATQNLFSFFSNLCNNLLLSTGMALNPVLFVSPANCIFTNDFGYIIWIPEQAVVNLRIGLSPCKMSAFILLCFPKCFRAFPEQPERHHSIHSIHVYT